MQESRRRRNGTGPLRTERCLTCTLRKSLESYNLALGTTVPFAGRGSDSVTHGCLQSPAQKGGRSSCGPSTNPSTLTEVWGPELRHEECPEVRRTEPGEVRFNHRTKRRSPPPFRLFVFGERGQGRSSCEEARKRTSRWLWVLPYQRTRIPKEPHGLGPYIRGRDRL